MSDQLAADTTPKGVSPLRRKISAAVLLALVVVLLIEVRAGAGHSLSGGSLQAISEEGVFQNRLLSDVDAMLWMAPQKTVVRESIDEVEYRYSWFSLLRPLLQRPKAELFVVATRNFEPSYALLYNTEAPTQGKIDWDRRVLDSLSHPEPDNGSNDSSWFPGGPPHDIAGQRTGLPQDPAVAILDRNSDGELDEEEVAAASEILFAADRNLDGKLTQDELSDRSPASTPDSRRRPPMDDDPDDSGESVPTLEASALESSINAVGSIAAPASSLPAAEAIGQ